MADMMFALGQSKKKKNEASKVRQTKKELKDVNVTETVETNIRKDQFAQEKDFKATATKTKKELMDVNITDTIEKEIRSEQFDREKKWKQTGRDQVKKNTNFDMARSLFGGGGGAAEADYEEEEEEQQYEEEEEEAPAEAEDDDEVEISDQEDEGEEEEAEPDDEEYEEEEYAEWDKRRSNSTCFESMKEDVSSIIRDAVNLFCLLRYGGLTICFLNRETNIYIRKI